MKKIYILTAVLGLSLGLSAQTTKKATTTKRSKTSSKVVKTTAVDEVAVPVFPSGANDMPVKDDHANHNHGVATATASPSIAPAVDMAKPIGEDNLNLAEAAHDFGKIQQGKPVTYDFKFSNKGKTELKLDNVQAGCGCTTPTWKPGPYKANEEAVINVGYNAAGVGPFTKQVTITYNGGLSKVLTITGEVLAAPATPAPENKGVQILKGN